MFDKRGLAEQLFQGGAFFFREPLIFKLERLAEYLCKLLHPVPRRLHSLLDFPDQLIGAMGSALNAVILQTVLCGIMGAGFAAASVIWELDSWSLAKQSGVYFLTASLLMLPIAYAANWMEHSPAGFLSYAGIFAAIFVAVWLTQYFSWKQKIKKMNAMVRNKENKE